MAVIIAFEATVAPAPPPFFKSDFVFSAPSVVAEQGSALFVWHVQKSTQTFVVLNMQTKAEIIARLHRKVHFLRWSVPDRRQSGALVNWEGVD